MIAKYKSNEEGRKEMSRIGSKIKAIRTEKGMTQKQLAKKLGVAENFILEVEEGRRIMNDLLIERISRVLGQNIEDQMMMEVEQKEEKLTGKKDITDIKRSATQKFEESQRNEQIQNIQPVWNQALEGVLKAVPVYNYDMIQVVDTRPLPVISNKIEGHAKDKVLYIKIEDNDMIGYRLRTGDIVFGHIHHEIENNAICLVQYHNKRVVRQLRKLDHQHILCISNPGSLNTETVAVKDLEVLVRFEKAEIRLP